MKKLDRGWHEEVLKASKRFEDGVLNPNIRPITKEDLRRSHEQLMARVISISRRRSGRRY